MKHDHGLHTGPGNLLTGRQTLASQVGFRSMELDGYSVHSRSVRYFHGLCNDAADHSGRPVCSMNCLRSLERWDRGFELHSRHGCLYCVRLFIVCVVLCVGRVLVAS
jgi:hypothetical protein